MKYIQKYYYYKSENLRDFLKKYYQYSDISLYLNESYLWNRIWKDCYLYIDYDYCKHSDKNIIWLIRIWPTPPKFYKQENVINVYNEQEFHEYFKSLVKIRYELAKSWLEEFIQNNQYEINRRQEWIKRLQEILVNI